MSDDDLGSFGPTTPHVSKHTVRQRQPSVSVVAGPSTSAKPASTNTTSSKRRRIEEQDDTRDDRTTVDNDGDVVLISSAETSEDGVRTKTRKPVNGTTTQATHDRGKGKLRAPSVEPRGRGVSTEVEEVPPPRETVARTNGRVSTGVKPTNGKQRLQEEVALRRQVEELRQYLAERTQERDDFQDQLRRLHHLRSTEAEKLAAQMKTVHEARAKVDAEYIAELKDASGASGSADTSKSSVVQFVHGDLVEEAKREGEELVAEWKQKVRERDKALKDKDEQIQDLLKAAQTYKSDLAAEIQNNATLKRNGNQIANGSTKSAKPAPGQGYVTRLYEDMTNINVIDFKNAPESGGIPMETYTCEITVNGRSLGFKLQSFTPPAAENPTNMPRMIYTPTTLAMETDLQFKQQLDFLSEPFTFSREQLSVFVRTLNEKVDGSATQESDVDDDE
ncbi:hypothetical protein SISNIDRAFT_490182 [Sistotremastrum niveocremeum HHB9708]|uniref:Monopolin complex subunit Csm1/Pcs1 C-terminal domain-containing protein n=1 Tax=Sistotremastrum niveocremeum HHB9708 TaxID=1314777 RepID=A0A164P5J8_9AGAM|nr:hypothetical protein SISNIDRAFT_490182 [Sistotremastrum niveocremeum HHB9708]